MNLNAKDGSIYSASYNRKTILTSGYISSTDGEYEAQLNEAGLFFKKDNIQYALFQSTFWKGTETRGVGINSYADSKFISFGNKNSNSEDAFLTPLVLNYGLNPDNNTQDILIYGSTLIKDKLYFNPEIFLENYAGTGIRCSGKLCIGDSPNTEKKLNVDGGGYVSGSFEIGSNLNVTNNLTVLGNVRVYENINLDGNLYADGALKDTFTSAPNLHIGSESGKIAKTSGSSKRFKTEIRPVSASELNPRRLYGIEVVQYKFKKGYLNEEDQRNGMDVIGFIAEDIYKKYPAAADCSMDENGDIVVNDWNFRYMIPAMLKLIQEQKKEIDDMKQEIIGLKSAE